MTVTLHDEVLAIIQAHKEGKPLQFFSTGVNEWRDADWTLGDLLGNLDIGTDVRVKSEPAEFWALVKKTNGKIGGVIFGYFSSREQAVSYAKDGVFHAFEPVHFVEQPEPVRNL